MRNVERLRVRVELDDPAPTLEHARAEAEHGDESWARWVEEHARGDALVVLLRVSVESSDPEEPLAATVNRGVLLEADVFPPRVEQQVAEIVSKDYVALAAQLREHGYELDSDDLTDMYVHVELGSDVRRALDDTRRTRRAADGNGSRTEIRASRAEAPAPAPAPAAARSEQPAASGGD
jgi:hypothetical protein